MQQLACVSQSRWIPLLLLGSIPMQAIAEPYFPVLRESGTHWFSFLDEGKQIPVPAAHTLSAHYDAEPAGLAEARYRRESLARVRIANDAYAAERMEELGQLSAALRQRGRYAEAFQKLEQHYFLARVARGLHDERHLPLLRELAELAELKDDPHRAHELRQARLDLSLKVLAEDDPGRIEAQLEWADWLLQRYLATVPQGLWPSQWQDNPWIDPVFSESDRYYRLALEQLGRLHNLPSDTRMSVLLALRRWQLLHLTAFHRQRGSAGSHPLTAHATGGMRQHIHGAGADFGFIARTLHEVRVTTKPSHPGELELHVAQFLLLGDWLHAMSLPEQAGRAYAQAYHLLEQGLLPAARIEQLLAPGLPVPDPERWYQAQKRTTAYQRHTDVTITIDAKGKLLEYTLDEGHPAHSSQAKDLTRWLAASRFRPPYAATANRHVVALRVYHD